MENDIALVYMVAGISSRFFGRIKQFAQVGPEGEKLIEYSLKQALPAGFTKIIFIVGNKTEKPFKEMFGSSYKGLPVLYALQSYDEAKRDRPWGTVDALCSIKNIIDSKFIICNGDDLYGESAFKTLAEHLKKSDDAAMIGYKLISVLPEFGQENRGITQVDDENFVLKINEVYDISRENFSSLGLKEDSLCSLNIWALKPEIINMLNSVLETFKKTNEGNRKIECLLPNELSRLVENKKMRMKIYPAKEKWLGVTKPEDEEKIREELKKSTS